MEGREERRRLREGMGAWKERREGRKDEGRKGKSEGREVWKIRRKGGKG